LAKLTLKQRFTYQKPTEDQLPRYEAIRKAALRFARIIEKNAPQSPDRIVAIRKLEECVMTANKAIALEKFERE